ncbi:hypothetical protein [Hymenobacter aerophilus]|uniref:hypothetical protein n=1 Tax=Hymenobacter aerophilus TaxID=119644 RepID=UPI0012F81454|nr:hypothetical protein [Hymenobacter aerophilus]
MQLLLSSGDKSLEYWILTFLVWIPQLLWLFIAAMLLVWVMIGLRRTWIRWVLMCIPYIMIGGAIYQAISPAFWYYKHDYSFSVIAHKTFLQDNWVPTVLALPCLIVLHIVLFRKQALLKARDASSPSLG